MKRNRSYGKATDYRRNRARTKRRGERKGMNIAIFIFTWALVSVGVLSFVAAYGDTGRENPNLSVSAPNTGYHPEVKPSAPPGSSVPKQEPTAAPRPPVRPTPSATAEHWSEPSQTDSDKAYADYREEVPIGALCEMLLSGDGRHIRSVLHPNHLAKLIQKVELLVVIAGGEDAAIEIVMDGYRTVVENEIGEVDTIEYEILSKSPLGSEQIARMQKAVENYNIQDSIEAAFGFDIRLTMHGAVQKRERQVSMRVFKVSSGWYLYPEDFNMSLLSD